MKTHPSFPSPLEVRVNNDGTYTLLKSFLYYTRVRGEQERIFVPGGFTTDFASIPRALWAVLPPADGNWAKAAVIHDYLYNKSGDVYPNGRQPFTRRECDKILKEGAAALGAILPARLAIYAGVRVGGWLFFK